jgi:hypothetical protein
MQRLKKCQTEKGKKMKKVGVSQNEPVFEDCPMHEIRK